MKFEVEWDQRMCDLFQFSLSPVQKFIIFKPFLVIDKYIQSPQHICIAQIILIHHTDNGIASQLKFHLIINIYIISIGPQTLSTITFCTYTF